MDQQFLLLTFDFCVYGGESEQTLRLGKIRFKKYDTHDTYDDDYFTNSTNPNTQPTVPIRFYGKFGVSDQIKRRHSRYFLIHCGSICSLWDCMRQNDN